MSTRVFVYGTLKRGHGNNYRLARSPLVGRATTMGRWAMLDGGFPVALSGDDGFIVGEVYEVSPNVLADLDRLESNGRMYRREVIDLELEDGSFTEAWMYVGVEEFWADYTRPTTILSESDRLQWPTMIEVDETAPNGG